MTQRSGSLEIAAFVNAKGSCSYRRFNMSGKFIKHPKGPWDFAGMFENVIATGRRFFPAFQPALVGAEKSGLPRQTVDAADTVVKNWPPSADN